MKFDKTLTKIVRQDIETRNIPMLLGEPGIGKSSFMEDIAKQMRTQCFTLACNQLADKADLTGARLVPHEVNVKQPDGSMKQEMSYSQVFYPHRTIMDAIDYALQHPRETPILFLDELNRTTPDVTSELLSIPTMRAIGNTKLPDNLAVVAAGNDKGNVTSLDKASISRFHLMHVEPDAQTFLGIHADLHPAIKKVIAANPMVIYGTTTVLATDPKAKQPDDDDEDAAQEGLINMMFSDDEDMSQITTPRTIAGLSRWLNSFKQQEIIAMITETHKNEVGQDVSVLQEAIEGFVGHTLFSSLLIAELSATIMTIQPTTANQGPVKPAVYDALKGAADITQMQAMAANMDTKDISGCILYALAEREDNAILLKTLAETLGSNNLEQSDMNQLLVLAGTGGLDQENAHALLATNTPIANRVSAFMAY